MRLSTAAFVVVALCAQVTLAQQNKPKPADAPASLHEALAKSTPQFRALFDVIKIAPSDVPKAAVGTIFAPNDAAVSAFLTSMGLTAKDLAAKPELVDLIVSYHFVPGHQVTGSEVAKSGKQAATGDDNFVVALNKNAAGKLTVGDVQGNIATVVSGPVKVGKLSVYVIDKVLMSGNYFNSTLAALKHYPAWVTTSALAADSGIDRTLTASKDPYTLFAPSVRAWKPSEPAMRLASPAEVADILKYHVVLGARQIPRDFKDGTLPTLLAGHSLTFNIEASKVVAMDAYTRKQAVEPELKITPENGKDATVQTFNIYAGKNMVHGIDRVLMPNKAAAKPAAAAGPAATTTTSSKVTTEAGPKAPAAAVPAGSKPGSKRLLSQNRLLQQIVPSRSTTVIGSIQTSANGVAVSKMRSALIAAATGKVPPQYRNRYTPLPDPTAPDGCLNCLAWAKP